MAIHAPSNTDQLKKPARRPYERRFKSASLGPIPVSVNSPPASSHSTLRPDVKAAERLALWSSPFADLAKAELHDRLPAPLLRIADSVTLDGLAPSTRSSYAAGLLRFTQFCDQWGINEDDRMPASLALLASFASSYVGSYSGKTISQWLSGLRCWHLINHAPWLGDTERLHLIRRAADKRGSKFKRPPRPPVSLDHLRKLLTFLDLNDPFHAAVWATAITSFFGCRRLGETTVPSQETFDPVFHASRDLDFKLSSLSSGASSISFHIPWTKTTRSEGFSLVLTSRNDALCPVAAIINHFRVNHSAPTNTSLFAYRLHDGSWPHMVKKDFMSFLSTAWGSPNSTRLSGHCFRIGGAIALLLSGVPPEVVAATGGWTSMAFLLYWRRVEDIIPLSTSLAYSRSELNSVSSTMRTFSSSLST